jgi:hypothetical protein
MSVEMSLEMGIDMGTKIKKSVSLCEWRFGRTEEIM